MIRSIIQDNTFISGLLMAILCSVFLLTAIKMFRPRSLWNMVALLSILVVIVYVASPALLQIQEVSVSVTDYLNPLKTSEYKSTFAESIGALLGSFLGITAALWTEHHFKNNEQKDQLNENAVVIYYDFHFAFEQTRVIMSELAPDSNAPELLKGYEVYDWGDFNESMKCSEIYIDRNWIRNVASLSNAFTSKELQYIYEVYDRISKINIMLRQFDVTANPDSAAKRIVNKMHLLLTIAPDAFSNQFIIHSRTSKDEELRKYCNSVWRKLENLKNSCTIN